MPVISDEPGSESKELEKPGESRVTKTCRAVGSGGVERGFGCFDAVGDHFFVRDTVADGMWIKVNWRTDYGRRGQCFDHNSKGGAVDCDVNLSEQGQVQFRVEIRDGNKRIAHNGWSKYLPIGQ